MVALSRGETGHVLAVEVDSIIMYEIRILVLIDARSREVNNAVGLIHILHLAHKPVALGNLARLCHAALLVGAHVIEVDVVPVVALRDPKHLLAIVDKLAP